MCQGADDELLLSIQNNNSMKIFTFHLFAGIDKSPFQINRDDFCIFMQLKENTLTFNFRKITSLPDRLNHAFKFSAFRSFTLI